jgi:hypothetical protein
MENWVTKGGFPVLDVKTSGVDVVVSQVNDDEILGRE